MTFRSFISLCIFSTFFMACGNNSNKNKTENSLEVVAIQNEVMRIHDEAMEKMGQLGALQAKLESASIEAIKQNNDAEYIKSLQDAANNVKSAFKGMKGWMYNYSPPKNKTKEEYINYFTDQEKKIIQVNNAINASISEAEALLTKVPQ